ncbi:MAG: LysR family transcriptional regulator [Minicystis sp.]
MLSMDLNLIVALDVLLEEQSVLRAARRMGLSAPAMSRTLARIREAVGDPILVRAGRALVPTARAEELRLRVRTVVTEASSLLAREDLDAATLTRRFTIRSGDALIGLLGAPLMSALRTEAPGVTVRFAAEDDEGVSPLRDGRIDLDIGVIGDLGPEIRVQALCEGEVLGVVRRGHPLASGNVTAKRFAEHAHLVYSRRGVARGPIDAALAEGGLSRPVSIVVPSFYAALHIVAGSDLVGMMPSWLHGKATTSLDLVTFPLPVPTPHLTLSHAWHPRFDADSAHRWFRERVRALCREIFPEAPRTKRRAAPIPPASASRREAVPVPPASASRRETAPTRRTAAMVPPRKARGGGAPSGSIGELPLATAQRSR